jgi:GNAT superfamily N-acetyltransferase
MSTIPQQTPLWCWSISTRTTMTPVDLEQRPEFTKLPTRRIFGITSQSPMAEKENVVIEPATEADLDELSGMLGELFAQESDFRPDKDKQLRGLRLIFEQPSRGRVFVLRRNGAIVGMINLLFTISTAEGGFVILLEDLVVQKQYQGQGYGDKLLEHAIDFAKKKNFLRITLLTDRPENVAQAFFRKHGFAESSMIPMRLWIAPQQNSD